MKRHLVRLEDVADWRTLATAFGRAAAGKRGRPDVEAFRAGLDGELSRLSTEIRSGEAGPRPMRRFSIRDPKPRIIHAPQFRDRVLHHALIAHVGPVLDRALVDDCYACREGKGAEAAVRRAAHHAARAPWVMHVDVAQYFPSIDHVLLLERLARKIKGPGVLALIARVLAGHTTTPGRGLPIGALTSQHFANFYLAEIDRLVLQHPESRGYVRYMDDMLWWADSAAQAEAVLAAVRPALGALGLSLKAPVSPIPSARGLTFCGYRVLPGRVLLSRRRRRRFRQHLCAAEELYAQGRIGAGALQRQIDTVLATTVHAECHAWRRRTLGLGRIDA